MATIEPNAFNLYYGTDNTVTPHTPPNGVTGEASSTNSYLPPNPPIGNTGYTVDIVNFNTFYQFISVSNALLYSVWPTPLVYPSTSDTNTIQGPSGHPSTSGFQGPSGTQATFGESGTFGAQGIFGESGSFGPQGTFGESGSFGAQGIFGESGSFGPQNTFGESGSFSTQNTFGESGSFGPQNTFGESGSFSTQGIFGESGTFGESTGPSPGFYSNIPTNPASMFSFVSAQTGNIDDMNAPTGVPENSGAFSSEISQAGMAMAAANEVDVNAPVHGQPTQDRQSVFDAWRSELQDLGTKSQSEKLRNSQRLESVKSAIANNQVPSEEDIKGLENLLGQYEREIEEQRQGKLQISDPQKFLEIYQNTMKAYVDAKKKQLAVFDHQTEEELLKKRNALLDKRIGDVQTRLERTLDDINWEDPDNPLDEEEAIRMLKVFNMPTDEERIHYDWLKGMQNRGLTLSDTEKADLARLETKIQNEIQFLSRAPRVLTDLEAQERQNIMDKEQITRARGLEKAQLQKQIEALENKLKTPPTLINFGNPPIRDIENRDFNGFKDLPKDVRDQVAAQVVQHMWVTPLEELIDKNMPKPTGNENTTPPLTPEKAEEIALQKVNEILDTKTEKELSVKDLGTLLDNINSMDESNPNKYRIWSAFTKYVQANKHKDQWKFNGEGSYESDISSMAELGIKSYLRHVVTPYPHNSFTKEELVSTYSDSVHHPLKLKDMEFEVKDSKGIIHRIRIAGETVPYIKEYMDTTEGSRSVLTYGTVAIGSFLGLPGSIALSTDTSREIWMDEKDANASSKWASIFKKLGMTSDFSSFVSEFKSSFINPNN